MIHKAHNPFRTGALLAILATSTICATSQTTQSNISGVVYGPDGKALGGTRVWANIISPVARPVDRATSTIAVLNTVAGRDGSFTPPYVPAGDYVLCASNAAALNPCTWGGASLVKMTNGMHATGQAIRIAAGAMLHVHLDDPGGLLASHAGKPRASLIIGLGASYGFVPLPIVGSTVSSRDYSMLVPFNTPKYRGGLDAVFQIDRCSRGCNQHSHTQHIREHPVRHPRLRNQFADCRRGQLSF